MTVCGCFGCRERTFSECSHHCARCDDAIFCSHCIECGRSAFDAPVGGRRASPDFDHPRCYACAASPRTDTLTVVAFGSKDPSSLVGDCLRAAGIFDGAVISSAGRSRRVRMLKLDALSLTLYLFPAGATAAEREALGWPVRAEIAILVGGAAPSERVESAKTITLREDASAAELLQAIEREAVWSAHWRRPWLSG